MVDHTSYPIKKEKQEHLIFLPYGLFSVAFDNASWKPVKLSNWRFWRNFVVSIGVYRGKYGVGKGKNSIEGASR